tara:strand:- start:407 stop:601 length:195 start_codon:yes stop_codon:yes gene_type:complete
MTVESCSGSVSIATGDTAIAVTDVAIRYGNASDVKPIVATNNPPKEDSITGIGNGLIGSVSSAA